MLGYEVAALHYLMKPVREEKLFSVLDRAAEKAAKNERVLHLLTGGEMVQVPVHKIRYAEVMGNYVTLHAGEDPDAEREYLEVFRTQVRSDSNAVTTEVLSDTLEGVGDAINIEGLGGLLTFSAEVSQETADALRDPGQFAGA